MLKMYLALVGAASSALPPTDFSTKSLRHICASLPKMIAPGSDSGAGAAATAAVAASGRVGAAFKSTRNLSRSPSACFFVIAFGPLLGPTIRRFRVLFTEPSGCGSSCQ